MSFVVIETQASVFITFPNISLAKVLPLAEPKVKGWKNTYLICGKKFKVTLVKNTDERMGRGRRILANTLSLPTYYLTG